MSKSANHLVLAAGVALASLGACSGDNKSESKSADTTTAQAPVASPDAPLPANATTASAEPKVMYASLTGDPVKGGQVFVQCKTCHVVEAGQNRIGPSLNGLIGRTAGQVPNFQYSAANKNSGIVWTEEVLFEYLEDPRKKVPGTKMVFAGLKKPQDRADVIAWLRDNTK